MFGAIVTQPTSPEADIGLLFMDGGGYLDMCGHGCMGAVVALIETGAIGAHEQDKETRQSITVDTPSGMVEVEAEMINGRCEQVSIGMPTAFWHSAQTVYLNGMPVPVDIAYGGNFFGLVDAGAVGLHINTMNLDRLKKMALDLRDELNTGVKVVHPLSGEMAAVALIEFYEEGQPAKNTVIFGAGQVDRSPCGTGTCAKMAMLYNYGKLDCGQEYVQQGVLGTQFTGKILRETAYGSMPAVMPQVTGKAFVTGFHHFVAQPHDPFPIGFQLATKGAGSHA